MGSPLGPWKVNRIEQGGRRLARLGRARIVEPMQLVSYRDYEPPSLRAFEPIEPMSLPRQPAVARHHTSATPLRLTRCLDDLGVESVQSNDVIGTPQRFTRVNVHLRSRSPSSASPSDRSDPVLRRYSSGVRVSTLAAFGYHLRVVLNRRFSLQVPARRVCDVENPTPIWDASHLGRPEASSAGEQGNLVCRAARVGQGSFGRMIIGYATSL